MWLPNTVTSIIVPEESKYFTSIDGVVLSKNKTTLVYYPQKKPAADLTTNPELVEVWKNLTGIENFGLYKYQGQLVMPEGLEYIGVSAFYGNTKLTAVHIPAKVRQIGASAFASCNNLEIFTFAEESILESIGDSAFQSTKIAEIALPVTIKELGAEMFASGKLKKLIIPEGVTAIDNLFLYNLKMVEEIVLPSTLEIIGNNAFYGTSISRITIPAGVKSIAYSAFERCDKLESVTFEEGSSLQTIGQFAFSGCSSLKEIVLPESVVLIEEKGYTFYECTALERAVLSKGLEYIPNSMFEGCTNLKTVEMPEVAEYIGELAFSGCAKLESITIPANTTSIGDNAFDGCTALKAVNMSEDSALVTLGTSGTECAIFRGTTSLEYFYMPDGIKETGTGLFEDSGIRQIRVSANLQVIENGTFKNCANLTAVELPTTVHTIGDEAFMGCAKLENFAVPVTVTTIGNSAFQGCEAITEIDLPSGVIEIGNDTFRNCTALTRVVLPDTLIQMGGSSFVGCSSMTELVVNTESYKMVDGILYDATGYTIVYVPIAVTGEIVMRNTVREIAPGAFAGSQITSVIISDFIEAIPADAFNGCTELRSVTISDNVKTIGARAFEGCTKLESMFIPKNVDSIGEAAFRGCTVMSHPVFEERNTRFTLSARAFEDCKAITEILLPDYFTKLPDYLYAGTGITELVIPEYVTDLSSTGTFMNCTSLKTIVWHDRLTGALGSRLFMNTGLESVEIPAFVTTLGTRAINAWRYGPYYGETFKDCKQLTTVTFAAGSKMTTMYGWSFAGCEKLTGIDFTNAPMNLSFDSYAFAGSYFTELNLCSQGKSMTYTFGNYEGEGTSRDNYCPTIKKLTINVRSFYEGALAGITNAEEIYINIDTLKNTTPPLFGHLTGTTTVYITQTNPNNKMTWEQITDEKYFDLSGGVKVIIDGVSYDQWLAEQETAEADE